MSNSVLVLPGIKRGTESLANHLFDGVTNQHESDPTLFTKLYPSVSEYDPKNAMSVFTGGRVGANVMVAGRKAREIMTGVYSFDEPTLNMQRIFSNLVNEKIKPELDAELFTTNGLHTTADSIRSVSGYPQLPVSALPRSNAKERERLGLAEKMTLRQREIAISVWDEVWGNLKPTAINIPKFSATGPSRNVNDAEYKLQYCLGMFSNNRYNSMLKTFKSEDLGALHRDFEMAIVMGTNVRWQVDNPGKKREYWSLTDCEKEISPEKRQIVTKVVINGVEYDDFAAMRTRLVNAGPWTTNSMLQPFAAGCMYAMFELYPQTWHRDEVDLDKQMEGLYLWNGDVSSYDHSFSEEMLDLTIESGKKFISEEIMDLASALYYAAYFTRPLSADDRPTLMGDPRKYLDKQIIAGNRSGHAFTSLVAKVWKVIESLCIFDKMGYDVIRNLKPFLKGQMPLGVVNNGDDEIAWFKEYRDYALYSSIRENPQPDAMFKVSREEGAVFSGKVFQKIGDRKYQAVERLTTPFQRILCPERSIGGNFRKFWPYGMLERHNRRDSHPVLAEMWSIFDHSWRQTLEPYHGTFLGIIQRAAQTLPFDASSLSWKDIMVLDDPAKMYHRFTNDEISEEVLRSAFKKLQPQFFMHIFEEHYQGNIL